jgi:RES domain-containing protein
MIRAGPGVRFRAREPPSRADGSIGPAWRRSTSHSASFNTAFREVSAGFAHRLTAYVLCSYDVECEDVLDLCIEAGRAAHGIRLSDLACAWGDALIAGREPASWTVVRRLLADGCAGMLVPSFANGATADDRNLVLWRWGPNLPHKVTVYDPSGKLPKNQLSWK